MSKAAHKFSENSSVLAKRGFPNHDDSDDFDDQADDLDKGNDELYSKSFCLIGIPLEDILSTRLVHCALRCPIYASLSERIMFVACQVLSLVPYITLVHNILAPSEPDQLLQLATQKIKLEPTVSNQ